MIGIDQDQIKGEDQDLTVLEGIIGIEDPDLEVETGTDIKIGIVEETKIDQRTKQKIKKNQSTKTSQETKIRIISKMK